MMYPQIEETVIGYGNPYKKNSDFPRKASTISAYKIIEEIESNDDYIPVKIGVVHEYLPPKLKDLACAINDARYIYSLEEGWNESNAATIDEQLWITAMRFLTSHAIYVYTHKQIVLDTPEINPVPDGTIDLSWRSSGGRMLINLKKENGEYGAYYYGDQYREKYPIKGIVSTASVSPFFAEWISANLNR